MIYSKQQTTYAPSVSLKTLPTENSNEDSFDIDILETRDIVALINREDRKVAQSIEDNIDRIASAIDCIVSQMKKGGRLFYAGAGTSGRIGVLDASECSPTYGTDPSLVQGIIAGGDFALRNAVEGAEDNLETGQYDMEAAGLNEKDVLVGIAASGRTPWVIGTMMYAREKGAAVIALTCHSESEMASLADIHIATLVGPEVITGSTRMKSGSAHKMVLNMLTTTTMIKLGKVYHNLMVDLQATNSKLEKRSVSIVMEATGAPLEDASDALQKAGGNCKLAIMLLLTDAPLSDAKQLLEQHQGYIRKALKTYREEADGIKALV